jgi:hypothetical protein
MEDEGWEDLSVEECEDIERDYERKRLMETGGYSLEKLMYSVLPEDELMEIAISSDSFDEFSERCLETVLSRIYYGKEGISLAWKLPKFQEYLKEKYEELRQT